MPNRERSKIRHYFFLLRWFLIGRYHCGVSPMSKKWFVAIHKILWLFVLYSIMCTIQMGATWVASFL